MNQLKIGSLMLLGALLNIHVVAYAERSTAQKRLRLDLVENNSTRFELRQSDNGFRLLRFGKNNLNESYPISELLAQNLIDDLQKRIWELSAQSRSFKNYSNCKPRVSARLPAESEQLKICIGDSRSYYQFKEFIRKISAVR